jgi:hypothetical protein
MFDSIQTCRWATAPHFLCPATNLRGGCLSDYRLCVNVTVNTYALVTFHSERVCTVQHCQVGPISVRKTGRPCTRILFPNWQHNSQVDVLQ